MEICVIGTGYVGLVSGACFADLGHNVICVDRDEAKLLSLGRGRIPFHEPHLDTIVRRNSKNGRLRFTSDIDASIRRSQVVLICVGTASKPDGSVELVDVFDVGKTIGDNLNNYKIVVCKSTVPVGTAQEMQTLIAGNSKTRLIFDVVSNPEFLREGEAVSDFLRPDRIVIGAFRQKPAEVVADLYKPMKSPVLITNPATAELIKYASNAFLATKISFINEISRICEKMGVKVNDIAEGMGYDKRIGPLFLKPGPGWGGSCLPKDCKALLKMAGAHKEDFNLLRATIESNVRQQSQVVSKLRNLLGSFHGKKVGALGVSFKANTDDVRESPALNIIRQVVAEGALVHIFDPLAEKNASEVLKDHRVSYADDPYEVVEGKDALVFLTEWEEFRSLDFKRVKPLLKSPFILDARNCLDAEYLRDMGFKYEGLGV